MLMDTAEFIELEQTSPARGRIIVNVAHITLVSIHGGTGKAEITINGIPAPLVVNENAETMKALLGIP